MSECRKCHKTVEKCTDCNGQTKKSLLGDTLTCSTCRSTGSVCKTHGGFWQ